MQSGKFKCVQGTTATDIYKSAKSDLLLHITKYVMSQNTKVQERLDQSYSSVCKHVGRSKKRKRGKIGYSLEKHGFRFL